MISERERKRERVGEREREREAGKREDGDGRRRGETRRLPRTNFPASHTTLAPWHLFDHT